MLTTVIFGGCLSNQHYVVSLKRTKVNADRQILILWLFLSEKDYENAIKYYSEALELNPSNAIYYSNRSLAYLRTECYGYALADATRALEIDKNYIKGYYRRATSNMALGKFKAALKDYETVRLLKGDFQNVD